MDLERLNFGQVTSVANQMQAFSWYFISKKCLVQFGRILLAVKFNENLEKWLDFCNGIYSMFHI